MPKDSVTCPSSFSVGPATSTNTSSSTVAAMLRLDRIFTPLSRPVATEIEAAAVIATMIAIWTGVTSGTPQRMFRPAEICSTPKPTDTARPKTVPMMPSASSSLPGVSYTLRPRIGANMEDMRAGILRLYTK